jgi:uncharacterized FlaG/YvyC family protein
MDVLKFRAEQLGNARIERPVQNRLRAQASSERPSYAQAMRDALSAADFVEAPPERSLRPAQNERQQAAESIANAAARANEQISRLSSFRLSYGVHEATQIVMVRVYDGDSKELIRELPPEQRLDAIARIRDLSGILTDSTI